MSQVRLSPELGAALEHARDPGADPALSVLARALEASWAEAETMLRVYRRMDRLLQLVLSPRARRGLCRRSL